MKVRPVSLIPTAVPENIPQILINRERLKGDLKFDVELLGDGDQIIKELIERMDNDYQGKISETDNIEEVSEDKFFTVKMRNSENMSYIFKGAERIFEEDRSRVVGEEKNSSESSGSKNN